MVTIRPDFTGSLGHSRFSRECPGPNRTRSGRQNVPNSNSLPVGTNYHKDAESVSAISAHSSNTLTKMCRIFS